MYRVSPFVRHFGLALLAGTGTATLWVNLAPASYYDAIEWRMLDLPVPSIVSAFPVGITPLQVVSEALMALFLFFVGKELWEALVLQRGAMSGRNAGLPTLMVIGGAIGAIVAWLAGTALWETALEAGPTTGWQVPIGSDVVLGYLVGRLIFGPAHVALHFLLLVLIASDILGLVILGLSQPWPDLHLVWLILPAFSLFSVWFLFSRLADPRRTERDHRRAFHLWPYVVAGLLSWLGFLLAGLPGALGLLPVIAIIPHADRAFGLFAEAEEFLHDPLNRLAHLMVRPLLVVLFLFGLTRGGVDFQSLAPTSATVIAALWLGKPVGMLIGALIAHVALGLPRPAGLGLREIVLVCVIAGMGFTVPVLAIDSALPGGGMAEAARAGLALSLLAGAVAMMLARVLPVRR